MYSLALSGSGIDMNLLINYTEFYSENPLTIQQHLFFTMVGGV